MRVCVLVPDAQECSVRECVYVCVCWCLMHRSAPYVSVCMCVCVLVPDAQWCSALECVYVCVSVLVPDAQECSVRECVYVCMCAGAC